MDGTFDVGQPTVQSLLSSRAAGWDFLVLNDYSQAPSKPANRAKGLKTLVAEIRPLAEGWVGVLLRLVTPPRQCTMYNVLVLVLVLVIPGGCPLHFSWKRRELGGGEACCESCADKPCADKRSMMNADVSANAAVLLMETAAYRAHAKGSEELGACASRCRCASASASARGCTSAHPHVDTGYVWVLYAFGGCV